MLLALFGAAPAAWAQATTPAPTRPTSHAYIDAAETCPAAEISGTSLGRGDHYVAAPTSTDMNAETGRKPVLVVFLGGSYSKPEDYVALSDYVASLGYGVINLSYPNDFTVGLACGGNSDCYGQLRGEIAFGRKIDYTRPSGGYGYDSGQAAGNIPLKDSVVNRLVCLLDYLGAGGEQSATIPGLLYWQQFRKIDANSPYLIGGGAGVGAYPDWSKIVIAGHSQGGGEAAFIGMRLPKLEPVRRVVMLSAPEDSVGAAGQPADWMTYASGTAMSKFWGLWSINEGTLGEHVGANWASFGGPYYSGVHGEMTGGVGRVGGAVPEDSLLKLILPVNLNSNRFQLQEDLGSSTVRHHRVTSGNCAPYDSLCAQLRDFLKPVWNYMFTGGYAD